MTDLKNTHEKKRQTCPICSSTFLNIFPAGECQVCSQLVCGHCIQHDSPDHESSICQNCIIKMTPYGRVAQMAENELLEILQDTASKESALVARLLGEKKYKTAVLPLCQALKSSRIDVRREAAIALGSMESNQAVPYLIDVLNDPEPAVRSRVISSLAKLGATEALPQIKKQLDDPSRQVAGHSVQALGKLMGHKACGIFKDLIQGHTSGYVRSEALAVLAGLNHEMTLAAALECLADPEKSVRISACKILIRLNDLEAAPNLEKLIEKECSASVRIMAQTTLNKLLATNDLNQDRSSESTS